MPVIVALIGAVMTGLTWWVLRGNGLDHVDRHLTDRRNAKLREKAEAQRRAAPLRTIRDPVDAAGVLMQIVAMTRGVPTPEQVAAIEREMRKIVVEDDDLASRMAYVAHAASQATDAATATDELAPLLREKLTSSERGDLERMLEAVAVVHQGPTEGQERLILRIVRVLAEQR